MFARDNFGEALDLEGFTLRYEYAYIKEYNEETLTYTLECFHVLNKFEDAYITLLSLIKLMEEGFRVVNAKLADGGRLAVYWNKNYFDNDEVAKLRLVLGLEYKCLLRDRHLYFIDISSINGNIVLSDFCDVIEPCCIFKTSGNPTVVFDDKVEVMVSANFKMDIFFRSFVADTSGCSYEQLDRIQKSFGQALRTR